LALNKADCAQGVDLMISEFSNVVMTLMMFGGEIILNEMMFGGDVNLVWVLLHKLKAQCLHFMKIVW
jgi:hypothetical protein